VRAKPPLYRFKSEEEAIKMVNDSNSAPPVYSYSPDLGRIWRVAEVSEFGGQRQTSQDPARTRSWWTEAKLANFALHCEDDPDNASFVRYMGRSAAPFPREIYK
jgi:hypothetical protein